MARQNKDFTRSPYFFTDFSEEIGSNSSKAATQTSLEKAAENGSKK